jgi:hypothetical protein
MRVAVSRSDESAAAGHASQPHQILLPAPPPTTLVYLPPLRSKPLPVCCCRLVSSHSFSSLPYFVAPQQPSFFAPSIRPTATLCLVPAQVVPATTPPGKFEKVSREAFFLPSRRSRLGRLSPRYRYPVFAGQPPAHVHKHAPVREPTCARDGPPGLTPLAARRRTPSRTGSQTERGFVW